MSKRANLVTISATLALAACGGADEALPGGEATSTWQSLMTTEWTAEAGAETNVCTRFTVDEEISFGAIHVVSPPQARHIMLTAGPPAGADGVTECAPFEGHESLLYAAGPTSEPFDLPNEVIMVVPAGWQLMLNVQIANAEPIEQPGSVNIYVEIEDNKAITSVAEAVLMGHQEGSAPSVCTMGHDSFPFALSLQAESTSRATVVAKTSFSGSVTLYDAPVANPQVHLLDGLVGMRAGEPIELSCSAAATRDGRAGPDLAEDSRCLATVYRYPAQPGTDWWCNQ